MHNFLLWFCVLHFALFVTSCSVPNLEQPECTQARDVVKRFYSFHFGNDMHPSAENIKARKDYLTADLFNTLSAVTDEKRDYFTDSENYPKAFRIGACTVGEGDSATLQVVLLWHSDIASEQKEVKVTVARSGDKWLIGKVTK